MSKARAKTITEIREQIAMNLHADAKQLKPLVIAARKAGNDELAVALTRKYDDLLRIAGRIFNEEWPGESAPSPRAQTPGAR